MLPLLDAHLDLAYLAVNHRDMLAPLDPAAAPHPPASVTLPALADGNVRFAFATIFTERDGAGPEGYPASSTDRAHAAGRAQLEVYEIWRDRGAIALDLPEWSRAGAELGHIRAGMGVSEIVPLSLASRLAREHTAPPLRAGILMENADPITTPDQLPWWHARGVCAIGLAWAKSSRYAGGNSTTDGLTDLGRALVREIDRLRILHDASHLSDRAFRELLDATDRPIMASHSNVRSLADPENQRHLSDDHIRRIIERQGVIGLNLYSRFLSPSVPPEGRASIDDCVRHIEHVCDLAGSRDHVGLGSDMDGGFAAARLPQGIDLPRHMHRILDALSARHWSDADLRAFAAENWLRFLARHT